MLTYDNIIIAVTVFTDLKGSVQYTCSCPGLPTSLVPQGSSSLVNVESSLFWRTVNIMILNLGLIIVLALPSLYMLIN